MYCKLCEALLHYLTVVAEANTKYTDSILIHNYAYFVEAMGSRGVRSINKFVSICALQRVEAETRYINWMISYECPGMSNLFDRIGGVSGRVNKEELGLYVPRKEVMAVFKDLNAKTFQANIVNMRKRLEKHCGTVEARELNLIDDIWGAITSRLMKIFNQLEDVGQASYQIHSELTVEKVQELLDAYNDTL
jgi:hypothetical protein